MFFILLQKGYVEYGVKRAKSGVGTVMGQGKKND